MGGVVADRAFSMGLSAEDGVATYVALSSPHNGATLARILTLAIDVDPAGSEALHEIAGALKALGIPLQDITDPAVHDLAEVVPPRPARGVRQVRDRVASDEVVLLPDHEDRRVTDHEVFPELHAPDVGAIVDAASHLNIVGTLGALLAPLSEWQGHGGSLVNASIRGTTEWVIRNVAIPPDTRTPEEKLLALALSVAVAIVVLKVARKLTLVLESGIILGRAIGGAVWAVLPRSDATWWTRAWPALVDNAWTIAEKEVAFELGLITRLNNALDRTFGAAEDDIDEMTAHRVRLKDPRLALVRAMLELAARDLAKI
jgi:hypothetical protein